MANDKQWTYLSKLAEAFAALFKQVHPFSTIGH